MGIPQLARLAQTASFIFMRDPQYKTWQVIREIIQHISRASTSLCTQAPVHASVPQTCEHTYMHINMKMFICRYEYKYEEKFK